MSEHSADYDAGDAQTFSGVRCELCGLVRMNGVYSHFGVVRCQDHHICAQVVALVAGARSTYDDLIEAGWKPADTTPIPPEGGAE